jgi:pyruvate/2-oxoglutarate dehydrogenase complex dihydrolipoamide acyltransferase (E2) component
VTDIHIPKMGMSTVEVDIVELRVAVGSHVVPGDPLVEIEGDKATYTVVSEVAGVITAVLVEEGAVSRVGDVVMRIEEG